MGSPMDTLSTVLVILASPFGFVGLWAAVCWMLGLSWRRLAKRWMTSEPTPIGAETWVSGMLGLVSYNSTLIVGSTDEGLDLRVAWMFRIGHPPLRIPWAAIRVEGESHGLFHATTRLRLGERGPVLRIPSEIWARAKELHSDR